MRRLLFSLIIIFFGCDKDEEKTLCANQDTSIRFCVLNTQNEDLLNPESITPIDESKIKLFYVRDGVAFEFYRPALDNPRGFRIYENEDTGLYQIGISLNYYDLSSKNITYIQWDDSDRDTIESTFSRTKCSVLTKQVWLNGKPVWNRTVNIVPIIRK